MFKDNLDEFNDSREVKINESSSHSIRFAFLLRQVVQQLMDEYRAATTKDYVNFGNVQSAQVRRKFVDRNDFFVSVIFSIRLNNEKLNLVIFILNFKR